MVLESNVTKIARTEGPNLFKFCQLTIRFCRTYVFIFQAEICLLPGSLPERQTRGTGLARTHWARLSIRGCRSQESGKNHIRKSRLHLSRIRIGNCWKLPEKFLAIRYVLLSKCFNHEQMKAFINSVSMNFKQQWIWPPPRNGLWVIYSWNFYKLKVFIESSPQVKPPRLSGNDAKMESKLLNFLNQKR